MGGRSKSGDDEWVSGAITGGSAARSNSRENTAIPGWLSRRLLVFRPFAEHTVSYKAAANPLTREWMPNDVRFIFPATKTVLSVGDRLDGAGDGVLVWLRRRSDRVVRARCRRRGAVLVGTVAFVRPLFCA